MENSLPSLEDPSSQVDDQDNSIQDTRPRSASNKLRSRRTNAVMVPINNDAPSQSATATKIAPVSKKDAKKIRPPSYTDRILVFSQEDRRNQVHVQAYDFCDTMTVSDHRPVSMVLNLEVNSSVKFHDNTLDLNNQSSNYGEITKSLKNLVQGYKRVRESVTSALYEISIIDLQVNMNAAAVDDHNEEEDLDETDIDDDLEDVDERNKNLDIEASWGKDALDDDKHRWSKKVEEQERERKAKKANTIKLKTQSKNKKVKTISNVIVVCPLPTKDPLLIYKKMNDIAEAFNVDDYGAMTQYEDLVDKMITPSHSTLVTVVDNPISSGNRHEPLQDHKAFVRPSSVFPWKELNESNRRSSGKFKDGLNSIPSQKSVNMKLCGVISSELGGHIMLKFVNAFEYDLGECVVSISHLLSNDRKTVLKSSASKVPISSGGQIRGEASMQIMVRRLSADGK